MIVFVNRYGWECGQRHTENQRPDVQQLAAARGFEVAHVAEWMCAAPARLVGLDGRKGAIAPGKDADFVVWDPDGERIVEPERMHQRHKLTPYVPRALHGVVHATYLGGRRVYAGGTHVGEPSGRLLRRGHA